MAPSSSPRIFSSVELAPVRKMTGMPMVMGSALRFRQTSNPSGLGMSTSSRIRSGRRRRAVSNPSVPLKLEWRSTGSSIRPIWTSSWMSVESSTTSTLCRTIGLPRLLVPLNATDQTHQIPHGGGDFVERGLRLDSFFGSCGQRRNVRKAVPATGAFELMHQPPQLLQVLRFQQLNERADALGQSRDESGDGGGHSGPVGHRAAHAAV